MKVLKIIPDTIVDGPGLRTSIYFAGCSHHCKGCHNPESWDFNQGKDYTPSALILKLVNFDKITLSGGDPFDQNLQELSEFISTLKRDYDSNIWCYTGYTFEQLLDKKEILKNIDVLVDGPFIKSLKDSTLLFRGSSNQRIIDVKESSKLNKPILFM